MQAVRDQRGEPVVVAVPQLVVGDRVVLVDDRHAAELEQAPDRATGVEVLRAIDEVVRIEQHLGADQTVSTELGVVRLDEPALTGRGDCLQRGHVRWAAGQAQCGNACGDRTGGDDHHLVAAAAEVGDFATQLGDRTVVDHPRLVGDRRSADLHHDPHHRSGW